MDNTAPLALLLREAEKQHGLFTFDQAMTTGVAETTLRRMVANGRVECLLPTVYRVGGAPSNFAQWTLAATLTGDNTVASHRCAAWQYRLDAASQPDRIDVVVPYGRDAPRRSIATPRNEQRSSIAVRVHRTRRPLEPIDLRVVDAIPCVSPTIALLQLAGSVDDETLEVMFESAKRLGLSSTQHLQQRFDFRGGRGVKGSSQVRKLLENQIENSGHSEFRLEVKTWILLRKHLLREHLPVRQHWVNVEEEWYRLDHAWVSLHVAVECEGWEFHGNKLRWKSDRARIAALEAAGWEIVIVTWEDVTLRPRQTVERIRYRLARASLQV